MNPILIGFLCTVGLFGFIIAFLSLLFVETWKGRVTTFALLALFGWMMGTGFAADGARTDAKIMHGLHQTYPGLAMRDIEHIARKGDTRDLVNYYIDDNRQAVCSGEIDQHNDHYAIKLNGLNGTCLKVVQAAQQ